MDLEERAQLRKEYLAQYPKEIFELPLILDDANDFFCVIENKMKKYINYVKNHWDFKIFYKNVCEVYRLYKKCISFYFKGNMQASNEQAVKVLKLLKKETDIWLIKPICKCLNEAQLKYLYKGRIGDFYGYTREGMFHIPFNQRKYITSQRYSINGIPCLYLGTSPYVCWEELGRPSTENFWVSRYEVFNKELCILDLSLSWQDIFDAQTAGTLDIAPLKKAYILSWIVQCACSIKIKEHGRSFREEYVFPQILMQNINKLKIDGISYLSVNGAYWMNYNAYIMKNLALPAIDFEVNRQKELSVKLTQSFLLTHPLNMGMVLTIQSDNPMMKGFKEISEHGRQAGTDNSRIKDSYKENSLIVMSREYEEMYKYTNFYKLEEKLNLQEAKRIKI